jgi:hypothetical protein
MNQQMMEKWLDDMEHERHLQGNGQLCKKTDGDFEYCCLGLHIEINHTELEFRKIKSRYGEMDFFPFNPATGRPLKSEFYLPDRLAKDLDLHKKIREHEHQQLYTYLEEFCDGSATLSMEDRQHVCAGFNDGHATFPQIAEVIRGMGWDKP